VINYDFTTAYYFAFPLADIFPIYSYCFKPLSSLITFYLSLFTLIFVSILVSFGYSDLNNPLKFFFSLSSLEREPYLLRDNCLYYRRTVASDTFLDSSGF